MVGGFGGVPQHIIPSSCNGKTLQQNKIITRAMVTRPKGAMELKSTDTDKVQVLRSRGDDGVRTQLAPHRIGVPEQISSPKAMPE